MASYTKFRNGFEITSAAAIDKRILLTKNEMLHAEEEYLIPNKYFAICLDDGQLYLFDNDSTPSAETGHYHKLEGAEYTAGSGIKIINNKISIDPAIVATVTDLNTEIQRAKTRENAIEVLASSKSVVNASATGSSTSVIHYITINGVEYRLPEAGESKIYKAGEGLLLTGSASDTFEVDYSKVAKKSDLDAVVSRVSTVEAGLSTEKSERQTTDASLSARISALEGRGRFLSTWDCVTGKPTTDPEKLPYAYKSGDYYLVSRVDEFGSANYKPEGIEYTGSHSTTIESGTVSVGDQYTFDGTTWTLSGGVRATWGQITGNISDQTDLQYALNEKASEGYVDSRVSEESMRAQMIENELSWQISSVSYQTAELSSRVSMVESTVSYVEQRVSSVESYVSQTIPYLEQRVSNVEYQVGEVSIRVSELQSSMMRVESSIQLLQDEVSYLQTSISAEASLREAADELLDSKISEKSTVSVSGTGTSTEEAKYITIDGHEYKIAGTGSQPEPHYPTTYQTTINYGEDKIAAIDAVTSGKVLYNGDIAIVKEIFAGTAGEGISKYQHTAFIYDNTIQEAGTYWKAMDGNYNAENVYFGADLTYTKQIGELPAVPSSGMATLSAKGKNVKQIFDAILAKEAEPNVTNPSLTISSSNIGAKEVGTTIGVAYSTSFNAGSYTYGPATGITASNYQIKFNGQTMTGTSGTFDNVQVNDSTSLKITGTFDHTQGAMPKTNLGNDCPGKRIAAQSAKAAGEKGTLSGYRKMFYGTFNNTDELTSAKIRSLTGIEQKACSSNSLSVSIPVGAKRVVIAVPNDNTTITGKSWSRTVDSVKDINDSSAEIMSAFTSQYINVEGASNFQAIRYIVYICDYANPATAANTYKVNVK